MIKNRDKLNSYLITDPKYYTNTTDTFAKILTQTYKKHKVDFVCFRNKENINTKGIVNKFVQISKQYNIKHIYINSDIMLATKLNVTGVHLPSKIKKIKEAKQNNLKVIYSTHNRSEIEYAIEDGADYITYSPIFNTPNKDKAKGIIDLEKILSDYNINVFALGGIISDMTVDAIQTTNCFGFASIRYFIDN